MYHVPWRIQARSLHARKFNNPDVVFVVLSYPLILEGLQRIKPAILSSWYLHVSRKSGLTWKAPKSQWFLRDRSEIPKEAPYLIRFMYGIFPCISRKNQPNVGKYTIHGWYGYGFQRTVQLWFPLLSRMLSDLSRWDSLCCISGIQFLGAECLAGCLSKTGFASFMSRFGELYINNFQNIIISPFFGLKNDVFTSTCFCLWCLRVTRTCQTL